MLIFAAVGAFAYGIVLISPQNAAINRLGPICMIVNILVKIDQ